MQTLGKLAMLAFFMSLVMVSSGETSYTATEQYVKNMVAAESNRTDKAINTLRTEVKDAQFLKPSSIIAGENVKVSTNAEGQVEISSVGGGGINAATATNIADAAAANATNALVRALTISRDENDSLHVSYAEEADDAERSAALWSVGRNEQRSSEEVFDQLDAATFSNAAQQAQIAAMESAQTNFVTKSDITSLSITVDGQSLQFATNAFSEGSIYSIVAGTNSKMQLLRGQEFDFSKIDGLYNSVRAIIVALEGTVINYPSEVNTYVKNANTNLYYKIQANTNAVGTLTIELDSSPID